MKLFFKILAILSIVIFNTNCLGPYDFVLYYNNHIDVPAGKYFNILILDSYFIGYDWIIAENRELLSKNGLTIQNNSGLENSYKVMDMIVYKFSNLKAEKEGFYKIKIIKVSFYNKEEINEEILCTINVLPPQTNIEDESNDYNTMRSFIRNAPIERFEVSRYNKNFFKRPDSGFYIIIGGYKQAGYEWFLKDSPYDLERKGLLVFNRGKALYYTENSYKHIGIFEWLFFPLESGKDYSIRFTQKKPKNSLTPAQDITVNIKSLY